ncbi:hypothetical protein [Corynebacterium uterequi]|uniref:Uncharacterized protein n=1 Tax=Corynebacterium uterequi TaxID=1072256 RepID=A0A0G3HDH8_9CORY|nr:hypothetical protein [Corynebacterium uterequi]AKK11431.1 hypothetical protein CUTER_07210 [Corynebacterium uterequi]
MTLSHRPNNPIQARKDQVRRHSRNAVAFVGGGVIGGIGLALIAHTWFFLALGLIVAVAGGGYHAMKVRAIVNHRDQ